jgi:hypothetical protein
MIALSRPFESIEELIEKHLKNWHPSRRKSLRRVLLSVMKSKNVQIPRIAECMDESEAKLDSIITQIERFLDGQKFTNEEFAKMQQDIINFDDNSEIVLVLDRTNWKYGETDHNILVLCVYKNGSSHPILIHNLEKDGASNTKERKDILSEFKRIFPYVKISLFIADREFIGEDWMVDLAKHKVPFCIRIKSNVIVSTENSSYSLSEVKKELDEKDDLDFIKTLEGCTIFNNVRCNIACSLTPEKKFIAVACSSDISEDILKNYASRWSIECLFKNLKSNGFDLEKTHIRKAHRLLNLVKIIGIAASICIITGEMVDEIIPIEKKKLLM